MSNKESFIKHIVNDLIGARERAVQARIRQHLRGLSDRHLQELGFSRELLEQGPKAWPWRATGTDTAPALAATSRRPQANSQPQPAERAEAEEKLAA